MCATVTYYLSKIGQKQSLLNGGDGKEKQTIQIDVGDLNFVDVVKRGDVKPDGSVWWTIDSYIKQFDSPQTVDLLLQWALECDVIRTEKESEEKERLRVETLSVIRERKIRRNKYNCYVYERDLCGVATVEYDTVDWPYSVDEEVKNSIEAKVFVEELYQVEVQARAEAEVKARADLEQKKQAALEKKSQEETEKQTLKTWFEARGFDVNCIRLKVEEGCLAKVPYRCWESHQRAKNWMAIIQNDPRSPGGLARQFATKAKGSLYYILLDLCPGDAIEFGADYYTGRGKKSPHRWYGYVVDIVPIDGDSPSYLVLKECGTGRQAVKEGYLWRDKYKPSVVDAIDEGIARVNGEGAIVTSDDKTASTEA